MKVRKRGRVKYYIPEHDLFQSFRWVGFAFIFFVVGIALGYFWAYMAFS